LNIAKGSLNKGRKMCTYLFFNIVTIFAQFLTISEFFSVSKVSNSLTLTLSILW